MVEELLKYLTVYSSSAVKFIFGPTLGAAYEFSVFLTGTLTMLGTMTSVYVFTFFGARIKAFLYGLFSGRKRRVFTKRSRRFVRVWRTYGLAGIAFLTPILFTPIGGTIAANIFGSKKRDIFKFMWISALFWSYTVSWIMKFARELLFFV